MPAGESGSPRSEDALGGSAEKAALRHLPSVEQLVRAAAKLDAAIARPDLTQAARQSIAASRERLRGDLRMGPPQLDALAEEVCALARRIRAPAPARVINATGVVLHTNLGRAPLAPGALRALVEAAAGYAALELDLATGKRGSRTADVVRLLCELSGAESAAVFNNNAAALFATMHVLAPNREVVLSRGEMVEIGGSFRLPEIVAASGARLREVGTTNRTHLRDYTGAIGPDTALLLKVHPSNFTMRGFTKEVSLRELANVAREAGIPLIEDRGSGTFFDLRPCGIAEPPVQDSLAQGADLVLFSGDKLLGGPQCGIVLGRADLVERLRKSPLARVLRVGKLTLAALDYTLRALLARRADTELPVLRMLLASRDSLAARAERLASALAGIAAEVSITDVRGPVGGGALPDVELSSVAVRLVPDGSVAEAAERLRCGNPPVIVRALEGAILADCRTLLDEDVGPLAQALTRALGSRTSR